MSGGHSIYIPTSSVLPFPWFQYDTSDFDPLSLACDRDASTSRSFFVFILFPSMFLPFCFFCENMCLGTGRKIKKIVTVVRCFIKKSNFLAVLFVPSEVLAALIHFLDVEQKWFDQCEKTRNFGARLSRHFDVYIPSEMIDLLPIVVV